MRDAVGEALNGPLLWNESSGMFRPSSGNNANLTDVWGSALAVDAGLVTSERAARIVSWFGAHWSEVVQDGQIRHLAKGEYWPGHRFWEHQTYQNGGYWATASSWVLPVIGRNNSKVAQQLVRDAILDAQRNGLNEWKNRDFCVNCAGVATTQPAANMPMLCTPKGLGCQDYPMSGVWKGGVMNCEFRAFFVTTFGDAIDHVLT
jgi:hypothetical protein